MQNRESSLNRRQFALTSALAVAATTLPAGVQAFGNAESAQRYCTFIKYLRSMSYEELADAIAAAGFDGVEVNVRSKDGYIVPERALQELPKLKQALDANHLEILILTTDILAADQPHAESTLRVAADLGVPRYRLGFHRYNRKKSILTQLAEWQPVFDRIAELNRKLGISAVYQNHAGAYRLGATIWDLHGLIKNYPVDEIGCVWDLRHAAGEAGESWPLLYDLMKPHITAISVKDFVWKRRTSEHVALGEGMVDPQFYAELARSEFRGPISVHVEHLPEGSASTNLAAIKRDFDTLKKWMAT